MPRVEMLQTPLVDMQGIRHGTLNVSCIPSSNPPSLWDFRGEPNRKDNLQDIQVLEDAEYVYVVQFSGSGVITTNKPEVFLPDYRHGSNGRFRPGLNVGELHVSFSLDGRTIGSVTFEVLSRKINYLSDYRAMLKNIAGYLAEIIAERFAPSEQDFTPLQSRDVQTLYQQFAFVRSFLVGDGFGETIRQIISTPDQHWVSSEQDQPFAKGARNAACIAKALVRGTPRQGNPGLNIQSTTIPLFIREQTFIEDVDTPENRFIYHILQNWLELATLVRNRLESGKTRSTERGIKETDEVISILEQTLSARLFRGLGKLGYVPSGSPVMHRKEGYRELYRIFLQAQVAAQISWDGAEDVYGAGKKDVALLYEYWAFLTLASILSNICGLRPLNIASLVEKGRDGLTLKLKQGRRFVLRGNVERYGKRLSVVLFYNRSFKPTAGGDDGSWTREMAPDFSVRILKSPHPEDSAWLHFDAKYRIDSINELFGPASEDEAMPTSDERRTNTSISYKREDLLKMHAYKDAVRRSTGAFILFPGNKNAMFRQFKEIVPGIGAFALRPTDDGPEGSEDVRQFLSDVLDVYALKGHQQ